MMILTYSWCYRYLLGYDHETDAQYLVMQAREDDIQKKLPQKLLR